MFHLLYSLAFDSFCPCINFLHKGRRQEVRSNVKNYLFGRGNVPGTEITFFAVMSVI